MTSHNICMVSLGEFGKECHKIKTSQQPKRPYKVGLHMFERHFTIPTMECLPAP